MVERVTAGTTIVAGVLTNLWTEMMNEFVRRDNQYNLTSLKEFGM